MTAECLREIRNPSSDRAKPDDAPGLSADLMKHIAKMRKRTISDVLLCFDIIIIVAQLLVQIKK